MKGERDDRPDELLRGMLRLLCCILLGSGLCSTCAAL